MARKHRRRTHKRNKGGGSVIQKMREAFVDLQTIGADGANRAGIAAKGLGVRAVAGYEDIKEGYTKTRVSPTPSLQEQSSHQIQPTTTTNSVGGTLVPKEKKGGLLGLGTWFGLGGRRRAHTSFVNKMLRVKNSRKRNRAIRKYLTGGKKRKTRKGGRRKRKRKRKTKKRRRH